MANAITLQEYLKEMSNRLERFEAYWLENQKADPETFPSEMNEDDWDDQFIFSFGGENDGQD